MAKWSNKSTATYNRPVIHQLAQLDHTRPGHCCGTSCVLLTQQHTDNGPTVSLYHEHKLIETIAIPTNLHSSQNNPKL